MTAVTRLLATVTSLLDTLRGDLAGRSTPRIGVRDRSRFREPSRGTFAVPRTRSQYRDQGSETVSTEVHEEPHSLTGTETRERSRESGEDSRTGNDDEAASERIDQALEPLLELCNRGHLVGVTNRQRLHHALSSYQPDQVEHAIRLLCTQLRTGAPIRSPIGLLVRLAEQHHTTYFPTHERRVDQPSLQANECDRADDEGSLPESLPAKLLDELDRHVEASLRTVPTSIRKRLTENEESLRQLRLEAYRTLAVRDHPPPSRSSSSARAVGG
jgi:hypothetical protein